MEIRHDSLDFESALTISIQGRQGDRSRYVEGVMPASLPQDGPKAHLTD